MNILVIKQTSLGDVLHASGHIRAIKKAYPGCNITLLTASSSYELFRYNPNIDEFLLFEKDRVRRLWMRHPLWTTKHILELIRRLRKTHYDLAFDLQGRARSVLFLYAARAQNKFVKGRWLGLKRYHKPEIHAIEEMNGVLRLAGINTEHTAMEIFTSDSECQAIDTLLTRINPQSKRVVIVSPFTRWATKNWDADKFASLAARVAQHAMVIFTSSADKSIEIDQLIASTRSPYIFNAAGTLSLLEFAELVRRADLVVTGDSFPMHVASAVHTPLIALFGPTDEKRVGPIGRHVTVIRADEVCRRCYRRNRCTRNCINHVPVAKVFEEARHWLGEQIVPVSIGVRSGRS